MLEHSATDGKLVGDEKVQQSGIGTIVIWWAVEQVSTNDAWHRTAVRFNLSIQITKYSMSQM